MKTRTLITLPILLVVVGAQAQDISAEPTFGTVELEVGFVPDPHVVALTAGGSIGVSSELADGCAGFIADAPDVDFMYTAGSAPLYFAATSESDTTLVINQPDGTWLCNDDADGFNPRIALESPQSGLYNIWVGSYAEDEMPEASLSISELAPVDAFEAVAPSGLDISAEPGFGTIELETGFAEDPNQTPLLAGGPNELSSDLAPGCVGFVASAPDVDLIYSAGRRGRLGLHLTERGPLNIYVTSEADTTLAVNLPDGTWACSDDSEGFNPALSFESPQSGLYNIFVGSYESEELPAAVLNISEIDPQW